jgi:phosphopantetheinyl transferase
MPFFREIMPAAGIRAGTWHISETEQELLVLAGLSAADQDLVATFRNIQRKKHWLACRALLKHMLGDGFRGISYDPNGKPHLAPGHLQISISHAGEYAAAVCSEGSPVGIDIEQLKDRVEKVKERFMLPEEIGSLNPDCRLGHLYIFWCGREALYKLHGRPDLDFRDDIQIHPFDYLCNTINTGMATLKLDGREEQHSLHFEKLGDYMLAIAW